MCCPIHSKIQLCSFKYIKRTHCSVRKSPAVRQIHQTDRRPVSGPSHVAYEQCARHLNELRRRTCLKLCPFIPAPAPSIAPSLWARLIPNYCANYFKFFFRKQLLSVSQRECVCVPLKFSISGPKRASRRLRERLKLRQALGFKAFLINVIICLKFSHITRCCLPRNKLEFRFVRA